MRSSLRFVAPALLLVLVLAAAPVGASPVPVCFEGAATPGHLGTSGDDVIEGTAGDDVIIGLGGNDTLSGLGGRDRICGGEGNDLIDGGADGDRLSGGEGDDTVFGRGGSDGLMLGGGGNDVLNPGTGAEGHVGTVEGGDGNDRIVLNKWNDLDIFGGPGRDTLDFRRAPWAVYVDLRYDNFMSPGDPIPIIGYWVYDVENVYGSPYSDFIHGDNHRNRLLGFGGNDQIYGHANDDYLDGGEGDADALYGGIGVDACVGGETTVCEG